MGLQDGQVALQDLEVVSTVRVRRDGDLRAQAGVDVFQALLVRSDLGVVSSLVVEQKPAQLLEESLGPLVKAVKSAIIRRRRRGHRINYYHY